MAAPARRPAHRAKEMRANSFRLMTLLFVLRSSQQAVPKSKLLEIEAYRDVDDAGRMFERDKALLREMGVDIVTTKVGNEERYLVASNSFVLPEVEFTPEEARVLALAQRVWSEESLGESAAEALAKLAAVGVELDVETGRAFQPHLDSEPGLPELWHANRDRQRVRFTYRSTRGEVRERDVEPWMLGMRGGAWYLIGRDRDRGERRTFKLARIVGQPKAYGRPGAYTLPEDLDAGALMAQIKPEDGRETAVLAIRGEYAPALRRRAREVSHPATPEGYTAHELTYASDEAMAADLGPFGADVLVLEPEHLRAAVVQHFRRVIAAHGGEA